MSSNTLGCHCQSHKTLANRSSHNFRHIELDIAKLLPPVNDLLAKRQGNVLNVFRDQEYVDKSDFGPLPTTDGPVGAS